MPDKPTLSQKMPFRSAPAEAVGTSSVEPISRRADREAPSRFDDLLERSLDQRRDDGAKVADAPSDEPGEQLVEARALITDFGSLGGVPGFAVALAAMSVGEASSGAVGLDVDAALASDLRAIDPTPGDMLGADSLDRLISGAGKAIQDFASVADAAAGVEHFDAVASVTVDDAAGLVETLVRTSVDVVGQERHLALSTRSGESVAALAELSGVASQAGSTSNAAVGDETEEPSRIQSVAARDQLDSELPLTRTAPDDYSSQGRGEASAGDDDTQAGANGGQIGTVGVQAHANVGRQFQDNSGALSVSDQVASRVSAALGSDSVMTEVSTDGVVKVLHIELKPENLGTVVVRISVKDDVVSVHLEAQHRETVAAIEREREQLSSALRQAGYVVDSVTSQLYDSRGAQRVEPASSAAGSNMLSQGQGGSQAGLQSSYSGGEGQRQQQSNVPFANEPGRTERGLGASDQPQTGLYV